MTTNISLKDEPVYGASALKPVEDTVLRHDNRLREIDVMLYDLQRGVAGVSDREVQLRVLEALIPVCADRTKTEIMARWAALCRRLGTPLPRGD